MSARRRAAGGSSASASGAAGGSMADLEARISSGGEAAAYEGLQLLKSRADRLRIKGDVEASLQLLAKGAVTMLKHSFTTAGSELCSMYISTLTEARLPLSIDVRNVINEIEAAFTPRSCPARRNFLMACVEWSVAIGDRKYGDPLIQSQLGRAIWCMGDYKGSLRHFAAGEAPHQLWTEIEERYSEDKDSQWRERIVCTGVLQFLAFENLRDANELMRKFREGLTEEQRSNRSRVHAFLDQLLLTCERDAAPLFQSLCHKYSAAYDFETVNRALLEGPIAKHLFGVRPPPSILSMLGDLLGGGGGGF